MNPIFFTVLLSIPFINMVVGAVVGLATLVHMLKTGRFARLLGLVILAGTWFVFAFLQAVAATGGGPPGTHLPGNWMMWTIPVAVLAWLFVKAANVTGKKGLREQISAANAE